ncbi:mammaglobin-A-like [Diceros bicornis minor]|uniref:mammaglobin-A-like n=1 Tax=Diceros bicornis minor TaxID=77932 RepID=UPI0026F1435D|nr:mammaglobin-A-like [Diceros bicornis minor]
MKLVTVLMLVALPLYCYAGSSCQLLKDVVEKAINPELSKSEYLTALQELTSDDATAKGTEEFNQRFLNQSNETLTNFREMMNLIYNSPWCALY